MSSAVITVTAAGASAIGCKYFEAVVIYSPTSSSRGELREVFHGRIGAGQRRRSELYQHEAGRKFGNAA
jgi:hypothetical protein